MEVRSMITHLSLRSWVWDLHLNFSLWILTQTFPQSESLPSGILTLYLNLVYWPTLGILTFWCYNCCGYRSDLISGATTVWLPFCFFFFWFFGYLRQVLASQVEVFLDFRGSIADTTQGCKSQGWRLLSHVQRKISLSRLQALVLGC